MDGSSESHPVAGSHLSVLGWGLRGSLADPLADLALGYPDLQALLTDILGRVVRLLNVDTATVLLSDASGTELVARAALGIEEEVRQGVRVPIGEGFAGRVAAMRRPLFLDQVDEGTVLNPILWRHGIRTMLGVPLVVGDQLIGVLHVGSFSARPFDERDAAVLGLIGERIGTAVRVRLFDADRDAAEAIQRSLVPSAPSTIGEFECAARYVPTEKGGIGGDWYDVFQLDNGDIWLIVGDVVGHGFRPATVMGRLRSAIRAYALLGRTPDEVLSLTDRKIDHFEVGHLATAAMAVFSPPYDEALVVLAGHPPFAVARPGEECEFVDALPGLPLGVISDRPTPITVPVPPGAVMVGYTDGLVERRHESLDIGLERLRSAIEPVGPGLVCERVMAASIGDHIPEDDIALIALRRELREGRRPRRALTTRPRGHLAGPAGVPRVDADAHAAGGVWSAVGTSSSRSGKKSGTQSGSHSSASSMRFGISRSQRKSESHRMSWTCPVGAPWKPIIRVVQGSTTPRSTLGLQRRYRSSLGR